MLDNLGHRGGVALLDGGIAAWQSAGLALSTEAVNQRPGHMELAAEWRRTWAAPRLGQVTPARRIALATSTETAQWLRNARKGARTRTNKASLSV